MDANKLIRQLDGIYGEGRGKEIYSVIMPGIMADFQKLLNRAGVGKEVSEEYGLEDGKGIVSLTGRRNADGSITAEGEIRH